MVKSDNARVSQFMEGESREESFCKIFSSGVSSQSEGFEKPNMVATE